MQWYDVEQNTQEWNELRTGKVTASQFGCFMANAGRAFGEPAKRYALQVALEIIKGKKSEFSFTNEHMLRGHQQEPMLECYMRLREMLMSPMADSSTSVIMAIVQTAL